MIQIDTIVVGKKSRPEVYMSPLVRAIDVADHILSRLGPMSAMKLQKLVYYGQVWTLVWTEQLLFPEKLRAWANGPVVRELYDIHRGSYLVTPGFFGGNPALLTAEQRDVLDRVMEHYGAKDPQWLSNLTHMEKPWLDAREGFAPGERCDNEITPEAIIEYYSSL